MAELHSARDSAVSPPGTARGRPAPVQRGAPAALSVGSWWQAGTRPRYQPPLPAPKVAARGDPGPPEVPAEDAGRAPVAPSNKSQSLRPSIPSYIQSRAGPGAGRGVTALSFETWSLEERRGERGRGGPEFTTCSAVSKDAR